MKTERSAATFFPNNFATFLKKGDGPSEELPLSGHAFLSPLFNIRLSEEYKQSDV